MKLRTPFVRIAFALAITANWAQFVRAAEITWDGSTSTSWTVGSNWVDDVAPGTSDIAKFTGTFATQPTIVNGTTPSAISGIWVTGLLGQNVLFGGTTAPAPQLTISGTTINTIPNLAVLVDSTTANTVEITARMVITGGNRTVRSDTNNNVTFSAPAASATNPTFTINDATLTFTNNGSALLATGNIVGNGGVTINSTGTGAVVTNSNNTTFGGQLTIAKGIMQSGNVNNQSQNGKLGNSASPVILGSSGSTGTFQYNGVTNTNPATANSGGTKRFTLATDGTGVFDMQPTAAATLFLRGVIDGSGNMVVQGNANGILSLNAVNTYTGSTTVASGKLALAATGSINSTPEINVMSGAIFDVSANAFTLGGSVAQTLEGKGTVLGSTTIGAMGKVAPGNSVGTLTVGNLSLLDGASGLFELENTAGIHAAGGASDFLDIVGLLNVSGITTAINLNVAADGGGDLAAAGSWTLMSFDSINSGSFDPNTNISVTGVDTGFTYDLAVNMEGLTGDIVLTLTAVPEPGAFALAGMGIVGLALRYRRRVQ